MSIRPNVCGSNVIIIPAPDPCEGSCNLQAKTTTANGVVTPDIGYDGLSQVIVDVPSEVLPNAAGRSF